MESNPNAFTMCLTPLLSSNSTKYIIVSLVVIALMVSIVTTTFSPSRPYCLATELSITLQVLPSSKKVTIDDSDL